MREKYLFFIIFYLAIELHALAQPAGYYNATEGKTGMDLYDALREIITAGHQVVSYGDLKSAYRKTDVDENNYIIDMYSDCKMYLSSLCVSSNECECYNREHSVPKSWFGSASPMYSDIVHVIPVDGFVNQKRSNLPYGNVSKATYVSSNGCKLGQSVAGHSGVVFEPADEYKGDIARIYFYMATRYADQCGSWGNVFDSKSKFGLKDYFKKIYLEWHRNDPVSEKEISRNKGIYEVQGNVNPFVDHPEMVEYIWGEASYDKPKIYPNPTTNYFRFVSEHYWSFAYSVFNLTGEVVVEGISETGAAIDVSSLIPGIYFVNIKTDIDIYTNKIIIQK